MTKQFTYQTPKAELRNKANEILKYILAGHYQSVACSKVFEKFGNDRSTLEALTLMESGKLIRLDRSLGRSALLASFVLLDSKGNDIKHTMINDEYDSLTFGNWFYETSINCYDHIMHLDTSCKKCIEHEDSKICYLHNIPLWQCVECSKLTTKLKQIVSKEDAKEFINLSIQKHNKSYWGI